MTQYNGLSQSEATARLKSNGPNEVKEPTVSFIQGVLGVCGNLPPGFWRQL